MSGYMFADNLRRIRREKNLSAEALGALTGIPRAVITNIETGRKGDISVTELVAFASALGVKPAVIDPRVDPEAFVAVQLAMDNLAAAQAALHAAVTA